MISEVSKKGFQSIFTLDNWLIIYLGTKLSAEKQRNWEAFFTVLSCLLLLPKLWNQFIPFLKVIYFVSNLFCFFILKFHYLLLSFGVPNFPKTVNRNFNLNKNFRLQYCDLRSGKCSIIPLIISYPEFYLPSLSSASLSQRLAFTRFLWLYCSTLLSKF